MITVSWIFLDIVLGDIAAGLTLEPQVIAHDLRSVCPTCYVELIAAIISDLVGA